MDAKAQQIKIIKRGEQPPKQAKKRKRQQKPLTAKQTAREMVATVSGWVTEFQQKRQEETAEAIRNLFGETPTTTGCANC